MISTLAFASATSISHADIVFSDDFESGLSLWTGKDNGAHHGMIVDDPFGGLNSVLTFNGLNAGGDIFTDSLTLNANQSYRFSFDYLGLPEDRSSASDTGGYVGFSVGTPSTHSWMWATGTVSNASDVLVDDGQWHSYDFDFTTADIGIGESLRVMVEDFSGSRGTHGDAFFDNFTIEAVPAPGTAALLGLELILLNIL